MARQRHTRGPGEDYHKIKEELEAIKKVRNPENCVLPSSNYITASFKFQEDSREAEQGACYANTSVPC